MYLKLSGSIESQLRDAYARRFEVGRLNQSSIARELDVDRSAIHNRLKGRTNMTIETIADMVWALGHDIDVNIFDPEVRVRTNFFESDDEIDAEQSIENFRSERLEVEQHDDLNLETAS